MSLLFFGKDPNTEEDHCPSVWVDAKTSDLIFQGWKADDEIRSQCLEDGSIPPYEDVIRMPVRMADQIRKALDAAERAAAAGAVSAVRGTPATH
ncbi:hypothetical protein ABZV77_11285 [Streptomyces sp. NPDC004732]|uniref:hypothetical protein n=1 Tax=Streptomyces sp. NPDC004732 TaxID=3154290 RepID=UPI0033BDE3C5